MIQSLNNSALGILGENILVNGKNITAYYIIESVNYSTLSSDGKNRRITKLENLITLLSNQRPNLKFSLFNINKILTKTDTKKNLIDTVKIWDPSYDGIPKIFDNQITNSQQQLTILAINIDAGDIGDVEGVNIKDIIKSSWSTLKTYLFSDTLINIDTKRIYAIEKSLNDIICKYGVRASKDLTFYSYISMLYPSYNISYNKNSFIEKNYKEIIGAVNQEIKGHFGYFTMSNSGVGMFRCEEKVTYGCILKVLNFPKSIVSESFACNMNNIMLNINILPKEKVRLMIRRQRADLEYEKETALEADSRDTGHIDDNLDLAEIAIASLDQKKEICELEANILIVANSLEKLKTKKQKMVINLADMGIIASVSFNQAQDFVNCYLKLMPSSYGHLCDLRFPLSFQLDQGVNLGDFDSEFTSSSIGETL